MDSPEIKRVAAAVCAVLVATACGSTVAHVASSSRNNTPQAPASAASSARWNPASPQPNGTILADKAFPMLATFNCRLPAKLNTYFLDHQDTWNSDQAALPGFLDLATGHFVSDQGAELIDMAPQEGDQSRTVASPVLRGWLGISYSWSASRWLPAGQEQVAPDGLSYAYPEIARWSSSNSPMTNADISLHVVDMKAGTDRVISTAPGWWPLDFALDGIYVTKTRYYSGETNNGLWKMDPTTGSTLELLPESATSLRFGGGAAWGSDVPIMPAILYRYDLTSRAREVWYTRPSTWVVYFGSDGSGRPLAGVFTRGQSPETGELWLLSGPNQGTRIYSGTDIPGPGPSDAHGIWMYGRDGLWLLQPDGRLIHVTAAQVLPLGGCQ